jgi:hypothetical protein
MQFRQAGAPLRDTEPVASQEHDVVQVLSRKWDITCVKLSLTPAQLDHQYTLGNWTRALKGSLFHFFRGA